MQLDEEKHRYRVLEQEYNSLLDIVKRDSEKHTKQLADKNSECVLLQKNLGELLRKYKERVAAFNSDSQRADVHFAKMQELFKESENTVISQEARLVSMEQQLRESRHALSAMEERAKEFVDSNHKKELDLVHFKEELMKASVHNLQQTHTISQKEQIIQQYAQQSEKQAGDLATLNSLRPQLADCKGQLLAISMQFETAKNDLEQALSSNHQLANQIDALSSQMKKYQYEIQRLEQITSSQNEQLVRTQRELDSKKAEAESSKNRVNALESALDESKAQASQLASSLFAREKEIQSVRDTLEDSRRELKEEQQAKIIALDNLSQKAIDIREVESKLHDMSSRVEKEISEKQEIRDRARENAQALNTQISNLEENESKLMFSLEQVFWGG